MRLEVDTELCQGHGRCYTLFPKLFQADDEGYGQPAVPDVADADAADARAAVDVCPECAIRVVHDESHAASS